MPYSEYYILYRVPEKDHDIDSHLDEDGGSLERSYDSTSIAGLLVVGWHFGRGVGV